MALNNFKLHKFKNKTQPLLCLVLPNKNIYTLGVIFEKKVFGQKLVKTFLKFEKKIVAEYGFLHVLKKVEQNCCWGKNTFFQRDLTMTLSRVGKHAQVNSKELGRRHQV